MKPSELGTKYDKIAQWWHDQHEQSSYGVSQFERAIGYTSGGKKALDIGCGAGGRFIRILQNQGFSVIGLDVSKEMVKLAGSNHPEHKFIHQDICYWETEEKFDTFYYSSIGTNENMQLLINNGLSTLHLELDQYPEKHVYTIATKP